MRITPARSAATAIPTGIHHHLLLVFSTVSAATVLPGAASGARLSAEDTTEEATLTPLLAALPATLAPLLATLLATLAPLLAALPATLAPLLAMLLAALPTLLAALPAALAPLLTALPAALAADDPTLAALEAMSLAASLVSAQLTANAAVMARPPTAAAARVNLVFIVLFSPNMVWTGVLTTAAGQPSKQSTRAAQVR